MSHDREQILKMIKAGQITAEQALQLLDALDEEDRSDASDEVVVGEVQETPCDDLPKRGNWWLLPVAAGAVVMAIGAPLMALGLTKRAAAFWAICCGWMPFIIGLTILTLGVWSRSARWFHLRVSNARSGRRSFALSLPLPLSLTAWIVRIVRPYVPRLNNTGVDEAIMALRDGMQEDDQPFFIDVQGDDDGEHVQIYIA